MSGTRVFIATAGLLVLYGVLLADIVFDLTPPEEQALVVAYYTRMRTASGFAAAIVPAFVLAGFFPLIHRLITVRSFWDIATFVLVSPAMYLFVAVLIPLQERVAALGAGHDEIPALLGSIKSAHFVLVPLMAAAVVTQVISHNATSGKTHVA